MLIWKKMLWLRERVREQCAWIERCGGDLAGYVRHYGDPGVPPIDPKTGMQKCILLPFERASTELGLKRIEQTDDGVMYEAPHFGDGGTLIFKADKDRLDIWERELADLEIRNRDAQRKADAWEAENTTRQEADAFGLPVEDNAHVN